MDETVSAPHAAALVVKFLLELAALAALGYWGANTGSGAVSVVLAVAAPLAGSLVWARWCAPKSEHRLPQAPRFAVVLAVFAAAAVGMVAAGAETAAAIFAAVALADMWALRRSEA
jgi:hypothetical protein